MGSLSADSLSTTHGSEFAALKRTRSRTLTAYLLRLFFIAAALYTTYCSLFSSDRHTEQISDARRTLIALNADWAFGLSADQQRLTDWLERHGTVGEIGLFNQVSTAIFSSAGALVRRQNSDTRLGTFGRAYVALHSGLISASFIVIASWRLWILVILAAFYRGWSSWRVHKENDLLGQTGNGRLFYSGVRIGLENPSASGAPGKHVRGLACPKQADESTVRASTLGNVLNKYKVDNRTNLALAGIVLAHKDYPAFVVPPEEISLLGTELSKLPLLDNCTGILSRLLELHDFYAANAAADAIETHFSHLERQYSSERSDSQAAFAARLQHACHRSLTPLMRSHLASIPAAELATIVLAYEAGKSMVYGREGDRWQIRSNFSELAARSVLHSVDGYGDEYDFDARANIRRALIYGSRYTSLGPVTVPVDLTDHTRAARQWVELLMAAPHDLEDVADEVEMHAIVAEVHAKWMQNFFDAIMTANPEVIKGAYATLGNLVLFPAANIIRLCRRSISRPALRRLEELIHNISDNQRMQSATGGDVDSEERGAVPIQARVEPPFSDEEIRTLSTNFALSADEVRDWSSLRVVLDKYGWIGRRVGDYAVPECSIVYAVLKVSPGTPGANHLGLLGIPAMIPLRATRLEERWGKSWNNSFSQVLSATMAENQADFEKLLSGISDDLPDESAAPPILSAG